MPRKNEILNYRTEAAAMRARKRLLAKYPVHDCRVDVVSSTHWLYPFRYLIRITANGAQAYWSRR